MRSPSRTSVQRQPGVTYPGTQPFSPSERYPECPFDEIGGEGNPVYRMVRQLFIDAGLDEAHIGGASWNPLGRYIQRGSRVFVLCNFVFHRRPRETVADFRAKCIHGSVLRALIDYVYIATGPDGVIEFGNAPLQSCQWPRVLADAEVSRLPCFYREQGVAVEACDLRHTVSDGHAGSVPRVGRLHDAVTFDLRETSRLEAVLHGDGPHGRPRVRDYDPDRTESYHVGGSHKYSISRAVLRADTVISLPKLKTHEKVGLTCALKGLVGAVANKDCLAHHRFGAPNRGGDEFPNGVAVVTPLAHYHDWLNRRPTDGPWQRCMVSAQRLVTGVLRRLGVTLGGAWHGNDTAWRMVHDLHRILQYGGSGGTLHDGGQRTHLALVDGVVAGEGDGPLSPRPTNCGVLMFSDDLVTADRVAWRLMGYEPEALKLLVHAVGGADAEGANGILRNNGRNLSEADIEPILGRPFRAPQGWRSYLADWRLQ